MDISYRIRIGAAGLVGFFLSSLASAAPVAVGRDQSLALADPSIVRVEVLGAENVAPGDPDAVIVGFSGQNACLVYVFEDTATLNQDVRLALFDANDNIVGLPIINVTNGYYSDVDAACGPVVPPPPPPPPGPPPQINSAPAAVDDNFGADYVGRNVLANDTDADGDALTAVLTGGPSHGTLSLAADGSFTYIPDADYLGRDSFTYRASDGQDLSNLAVVTLEVTAPPQDNTAPVAGDIDFGSDYAGGNVLANSIDGEQDTLVALLEQGPANGTLQLNADGTFQYTPNAGFAGADSFTFRVSDGALVSEVAVARLVVSVDAAAPPVAIDDNLGAEFQGRSVLDNDLFFDAGALTVVKVTDPEGGELTLAADGSFSYQPFAGFSGTDTFTYLLRTNTGLESNVATVTLSVDGDAAAADGVTGKQDADGTSVLANASPNELRVSRRIDQVCARLEPDNADQQDLLNLCTNLRSQGTTAKQALTALNAITPEELAAMSKSIRVLSFSRFRNIGARMARVREGGSKGLSLAGLNLKYGDTTVSGDQLQAALDQSRDALGMGASGDEMLESSRTGLWVRGDLSFGDQDRTGLESGFDFDAQTLTLGLDYRINDNLFVGTSIAVGQAEVEFDDDLGATDTDSYALAVYGSWYRGASFVDGVFSYGWSDVDTERNIVYEDFGGSVERVAQGATDGTEYYLSLNAGHSFDLKGFKLDPLVRFFYLDGEFDGFRESGAGGLDLEVGRQAFESLSLTASGQLSYTFLPSWGVVTPYVRLEYTREFEDSADGVSYRFANDLLADNLLQVDVDDPDSSYFVYGAGVAGQFAHGMSAFISYQALGSYENLSGEIISLGVRWEMAF